MTLSVRSKPYIIPEYSLTGDLLAYLNMRTAIPLSKQRDIASSNAHTTVVW